MFYRIGAGVLLGIWRLCVYVCAFGMGVVNCDTCCESDAIKITAKDENVITKSKQLYLY